MEQHSVTINTVIIPGLINLAIKHGVSADELLQEVGIGLEQVGDPNASISLKQLDFLYAACGGATGNPAFGLYIGNVARFDTLDLVGSVIATSGSIREALLDFQHFRELVHPFMDFRLEEHDLETSVIYSPTNPIPLMMKPVYSEMFLAGIYKIALSLTEKGFRLVRADFAHPAPECKHLYSDIFNTNIAFNQPQSALIFQTVTMDAPLLGAYPPLHKNLRIQAEKQLINLHSHKSLEKQVTTYLLENIGHGMLSMEEVAQKLNITTRTLQRRLKKENTSYIMLRERVRFDLAQQYLEDPSITMDEIAAHLGFSEPTNFYHAFKRWASISPGEYRKRMNFQSARARA